MKLRVFFLLLFYLLQATISQNLKFINLDNRPYSEASYPKYGVLKVNPKLDSLPDNFTFCMSFFYKFGFPTVYLQVDWITFEYDAIRIKFVSHRSSISARAMEYSTLCLQSSSKILEYSKAKVDIVYKIFHYNVCTVSMG